DIRAVPSSSDQLWCPPLRRKKGLGERQGGRSDAHGRDSPSGETRGARASSRGAAGRAGSRAETPGLARALIQDSTVGSIGVSLRSIFSGFFSPTANSCRYGIRFPTIRFSAFRRCSSYVERLTPRLRAMFSVVT